MIYKLKAINRVQFQKLLLDWFNKNKRILPWRAESHWYPVFLSEILLQQTRVEQVLPYYIKFINRFSDILSLSRASEQEVLTMWAGLGYYSRARNMLKAAKIIVNDFNAEFPDDYKQAVSLPGIGKYTASAILSIAYKKTYAAVDGNVFRVITRIFAIAEDVRLSSTQKHIQDICDQLLAKEDPGDYNEAIMELGATICKKQNPDCSNCPLQSFCIASLKNYQTKYPYKSASRAKRKTHYYVFIINFKNMYLLVQRPAAGLLASFWEFPVIEWDKLNLKKEILESQLREKYEIRGKVISIGNHYRHQYSHIDLSYQPVLIKVKNSKIEHVNNYVNYSWCSLDDMVQFPIHKAHFNLIAGIKNLNQ